MGTQAPLALPPPAGAAHWGGESPFGPKVLAALASANGAFVALATAAHAARPGLPAFGLSGHVLAGLARAEALQRPLVLPFTLFDLRFRDERFWRLEIAASAAVRDGSSAAAADPRVVRLARTAVTLAWHFAQAEPHAARLSLGLGPSTQQLLGDLPVGALDALAQRVAAALAARFCTRERFWALVTAALRFGPDVAGAERVQLLGLQLLGAESARAQLLHRRLRRSAQP